MKSTANPATTTRFLLNVSTSGGTVFKQSLDDSSNLPPEFKYEVPQGAVIGVKAYKEVDNNHFLVTFSLDLGCPRYNTWYVFRPHVSIIRL